ncbi:MAG: HD-GYP domain-containing protein [Caldicoprobacterales bacterium]|jgi:putative nucleotidyltransferase with HDIG domain|nr:HD-GYP domain-containing protein [Clostridiales bacterium]
MNKKLITSVSLSSLISIILLTHGILNLDTSKIPHLLFWIFLGSLFESLPIQYARDRAVSVTFAIILASQLSHGTHFTTIVAAFSAILVFIKKEDGTYKHLFNMPIHFNLINLTNYTVSMFLAGSIFDILERAWSASLAIQPAIVLVPVYILLVFIFNSVIMSFFATIMYGSPFLRTWLNGTLWALPNFIAIAPIGFFIYKLYQLPSGIFYVMMLLGPLLLARYSFKLYLDSREQYYKIIQTLTAAIEAKDEYTEGHARRVEHYVEQIAQRLKFSPGRTESLKVAALLHDIGKIGIDDAILRKPGRLTDEEWEKIKQHPRIGIKILEEVNVPAEVKNAILHHHERYDGGGYPDNLSGDQVSIDAYILAVIDAYDAMTSDRPYRKAMSKQKAMDIIREERGRQFHPQIADILLSILEQEEDEEEVQNKILTS